MNRWSVIRKGIAVVQAAGGVLGLAMVVRVLVRAGLGLLPLLLAGVLTAVFALFLLAAVLLWRDMRGGRLLTGAVCLLQLPRFATNLFTYAFFSPVSVAAGFQLDGVPWFETRYRPALTLTLHSSPDPAFIALNLLPLAVLLLLIRLPSRGTVPEEPES